MPKEQTKRRLINAKAELDLNKPFEQCDKHGNRWQLKFVEVGKAKLTADGLNKIRRKRLIPHPLIIHSKTEAREQYERNLFLTDLLTVYSAQITYDCAPGWHCAAWVSVDYTIQQDRIKRDISSWSSDQIISPGTQSSILTLDETDDVRIRFVRTS